MMYACGRMLWTGSMRKIRSESFGSSSVNYVVRNMAPRQGKMLKKLLLGSKKRVYDAAPKWVEKPTFGDSTFLKPKQTKNPRRITVLNSVLMEAIGDVMASGDVSSEILGLGIEITRVKVTVDYSIVNVFWTCSKNIDSDKTESLLKATAGPIRDHLCKIRTIGNVPFVCFVKDRYQENVNKVQQLLAVADFGSDFNPQDPTHLQNCELLSSRTLPSFPGLDGSSMEKNDLEAADASMSKEESLDKVPTCIADPTDVSSTMRMDILGLKHLDIMQHVVQNMRKAKAEHRNFPGQVPLPCNLQSDNPSSAPHGPALTISIRQFLEQKNREKHMSRKQELLDLKNAQFMAEAQEGMMNLDESHEKANDFWEEDVFDEDELLNFDHERSSEPPF